MEYRSKHPGTTKEHNIALGKKILDAFEEEMKIRHKTHFSYPFTPAGRATFIRDVSTKGWASTVADGQIPQDAIANVAHDTAVLAYEMNSNLFDAGHLENVTVVASGTAKDDFWDELEDDDFMQKNFKNPQLGVEGAPIMSDLKGAVFEPDASADSDLAKEFSKKGDSKDLKTQTGKAKVVEFKQFPDEPNKAPAAVMDWLVQALAQATKD
jgi:hypothetical protein